MLDKLDDIIIFKYKVSGIYTQLKIVKKDILYFEATKSRRIILKTINSEYDLLVKPLKYYQELIDCREFSIFVRNYLINLSNIEGMDSDYFILKNNEKILLGNDTKTKKISKEKYINYLNYMS